MRVRKAKAGGGLFSPSPLPFSCRPNVSVLPPAAGTWPRGRQVWKGTRPRPLRFRGWLVRGDAAAAPLCLVCKASVPSPPRRRAPRTSPHRSRAPEGCRNPLLPGWMGSPRWLGWHPAWPRGHEAQPSGGVDRPGEGVAPVEPARVRGGPGGAMPRGQPEPPLPSARRRDGPPALRELAGWGLFSARG